jgi:hypothetical protein
VTRTSAQGVLGLEDRVRDELGSMFVLEPVKHALSILPCRHNSGESQLGEMLRHRGGRLVDYFRQTVYGQFVFTKRKDDAYPCCVREHREHFDRKLDELAVRRTTTYLLICIHTQIIARTADGAAWSRWTAVTPPTAATWT